MKSSVATLSRSGFFHIAISIFGLVLFDLIKENLKFATSKIDFGKLYSQLNG